MLRPQCPPLFQNLRLREIMVYKLVMKTLLGLRLALSILLVALGALVLALGLRLGPTVITSTPDGSSPAQFSKFITRKAIMKDHVFVPANHKFMHVRHVSNPGVI